jgi:hypothetical protein
MGIYLSNGIFRTLQLLSRRSYLYSFLFLIGLLATIFVGFYRCTSSSSDRLAKEGESMARALIDPFVVRCGDSYFVKEVGIYPYDYSKVTTRFFELKGKASYEYSMANLKESERLNGIEHRAKLFFKIGGPSRMWHQRGGWGAWEESGYIAIVKVIKQNGKWAINEDPNLYKSRRVTFNCEEVSGLQLSAFSQKNIQNNRGKVAKKGGSLDVNGKWQLIWEESAARLYILIVQNGSELSIQGARINGIGTLNGDEISWTWSEAFSDGITRGVTYAGKVQGDTMAGTATRIQGSRPASSANMVRKWTALRIAK